MQFTCSDCCPCIEKVVTTKKNKNEVRQNVVLQVIRDDKGQMSKF